MPNVSPTSERQSTGLPAATQFVAGIALLAVAWWAAWDGPDILRHHSFFPLWLGYILVVGGILDFRPERSLLRRAPKTWLALFVASAPLWWVFEAANARLGNWVYELPRDYTWLEYRALATLAFSTVLPAIFVTTELWWSLGLRNVGRNGPRFAPGRRGLIVIASVGSAMFIASLVWPHIFFPLVWIGLFFLLDPLNRLAGAPSLAARVAVGDWSRPLALFAGGLTCGFFWEFWNSRAMPKWVYDLPWLEVGKIFEMPALGYGGYLPFALELYAAWHLLRRFARRSGSSPLLFDRPRPEDAPE
jgi:hypothetical protein